MLLERVEDDARAERVAAAAVGQVDGTSVEDARARLDEFLTAEPSASGLEPDQIALRRALGVL